MRRVVELTHDADGARRCNARTTPNHAPHTCPHTAGQPWGRDVRQWMERDLCSSLMGKRRGHVQQQHAMPMRDARRHSRTLKPERSKAEHTVQTQARQVQPSKRIGSFVKAWRASSPRLDESHAMDSMIHTHTTQIRTPQFDKACTGSKDSDP